MSVTPSIPVGIDAIGFSTAPFHIPLETLAQARDLPADHFQKTLGQLTMGVPAPDQDSVTLAADAAKRVLETHNYDKNSFDWILFATESGVDESKAASTYLHELLEMPARCRAIELKQACYSATAALQLALPLLQQQPNSRILLVASDIARYGLNTTAESSQGCAAVAMVLSANPKLLAVDTTTSGFVTQNAMDFWRPAYRRDALVDGKASSKLYLNLLEKAWQQYSERSGRTFGDHGAFCFHTPVPSLVERAHRYLSKVSGHKGEQDFLLNQIAPSLIYNRQTGNGYAASLYVSLCSLLENVGQDLSGQTIGFYSYGSGAVAEFFSGQVVAGYQNHLDQDHHQTVLNTREALSSSTYETFFTYALPTDGTTVETPQHVTSGCRLTGISQHKRQYQWQN